MDQSILQVMLALGLLLLVTVFASKITTRYGIPILLIFIFVGMLSGSEGPGGIYFDDPRLTHILGTISLIFILFSGGLNTQVQMVEPVWKEGLALALLGVITSTMVMSVIIHTFMGWSWLSSALLSATFSSTDASAVFGVLKTQKLFLKQKIQAIIELESGSNDPMAVFLTLTLILLAKSSSKLSLLELPINFFIQMSLGAFTGWFFGKGLVKLINWLNLEFEGLYPVFNIAGILCIYSITEYSGGSGFLSVYLAGLSMRRERFLSKKTLFVFHDGLAWVMQVVMFLALGLLVYPSEIGKHVGDGIFLSLTLILVARPLSVWLCLKMFGYSMKEIIFISWGGLRGAVPVILASYLLVSNINGAHVMFNLVFFIVIFSMLIQGTMLKYMARSLGVQESDNIPVARQKDFVEFEIDANSSFLGKNIMELNFPNQVLVVLIHRKDQDFIPQGNTVLEINDRLLCFMDKSFISEFEELVSS